MPAKIVRVTQLVVAVTLLFSGLTLAQTQPAAPTCPKTHVRNASGQCVCKTGYTGPACLKCAPNYYAFPACRYCLASTTCSGHGTCSSTGSCACAAGWKGTNCGTAATPPSTASAAPTSSAPAVTAPTAPTLVTAFGAVNPTKLEWNEPTSWGTGGTSATYKLVVNNVVLATNLPKTTTSWTLSPLPSGSSCFRVIADNGTLSTTSDVVCFLVANP